MPPTSNMRKTSLAHHNAAAADTGPNATRRTASGRAVRTNTTRPANYYARPFGGPAANADTDEQDTAEPGFFPALQYFSDAITALPREVMRQCTLMKEVEAKVHGPNERMGEILDGLLELPVPVRKSGGEDGGGLAQQGLLSLTANNSAAGSARASLINGVGGQLHSAQNSVSGAQIGEEARETEEELARRRQYYDLRLLTHNLLPNLDEKNVVLAEANRVLTQQLSRIDSVLPHLENEISEEARLGSMTHWAYTDNRQKKAAPTTVPTRRDVAATNSLAAAASAIHEKEIAQARHDAGREAHREKHQGKGKRQHLQQEHGESEFEDKAPTKKTAAGGKMTGKGKAAAQATGLGISTVNGGEPVKRRKVDKGLSAPGMERSASNATTGGKGTKANRETPRSTPAAAEPIKKAAKAKPAPPVPKKRIASSAQNSPALASSPLQSSFAMEPPSFAGRPQSTRLRQNSTTLLRNESLADGEGSRPSSSAGKTANGSVREKSSLGKRKAPRGEAEVPVEKSGATSDNMKREDVEMPDAAADRIAPSRSNSGKNSGTGRKSGTGTPRTESFPTDGPASMLRTRSTRSLRANTRGESSASDEPREQGPVSRKHKHSRTVSNHLVKQLAPFNRSPDADRHRGSDEEDDEEETEGVNGEKARKGTDSDDVRGTRARGRSSRPVSRRNTLQMAATPEAAGAQEGTEHGGEAEPAHSPPPNSDHGDAAPTSPREGQALSPTPISSLEDAPELAEDFPANAAPFPSHHNNGHGTQASHHSDVSHPPSDAGDDVDQADGEEEDEEEEEETGDPDDPNEPKYCYCNRGSYGEMVACDNDQCAREWFHLGCTELMEAPGEEESWFCEECRRALGMGRKRGGGGGRGRGRG